MKSNILRYLVKGVLDIKSHDKNLGISYRISQDRARQEVLLPVGGPGVLVGGHGALVLLLVPAAIRVHGVQAITLRCKPVTPERSWRLS